MEKSKDGARSLAGLVVLFLLLLLFVVVAVVIAFSVESATWMEALITIPR